MNIEEIKAAQELHYKKAKDMCNSYYENEVVYKYTFIEELIKPFVDTRLQQLDLLIEELQKTRNRIKELETLKSTNNDKK